MTSFSIPETHVTQISPGLGLQTIHLTLSYTPLVSLILQET